MSMPVRSNSKRIFQQSKTRKRIILRMVRMEGVDTQIGVSYNGGFVEIFIEVLCLST